MAKQFPNRELEKAAYEAGCAVSCMWQIKGPKGTGISWIEGIILDAEIILVQTFKAGGWSAFVPSRSPNISPRLAAVLAALDGGQK